MVGGWDRDTRVAVPTVRWSYTRAAARGEPSRRTARRWALEPTAQTAGLGARLNGRSSCPRTRRGWVQHGNLGARARRCRAGGTVHEGEGRAILAAPGCPTARRLRPEVDREHAHEIVRALGIAPRRTARGVSQGTSRHTGGAERRSIKIMSRLLTRGYTIDRRQTNVPSERRRAGCSLRLPQTIFPTESIEVRS